MATTTQAQRGQAERQEAQAGARQPRPPVRTWAARAARPEATRTGTGTSSSTHFATT